MLLNIPAVLQKLPQAPESEKSKQWSGLQENTHGWDALKHGTMVKPAMYYDEN